MDADAGDGKDAAASEDGVESTADGWDADGLADDFCGSASEDGAETGTEGQPIGEGLGSFFSPPKRKPRLRTAGGTGKSASTRRAAGAAAAPGDADAAASAAAGSAVAAAEPDGSPEPAALLGSFFAPGKRRARLLARNAASAGGPASKEHGAEQHWPVRGRLGSQVPSSSSAELHAASRAAWKRRGMEATSSGSRPSQASEEASPDGDSPNEDGDRPGGAPDRGPRKAGRASDLRSGGRREARAPQRRSATGMFRTDVPRLAVDSTRCHWLLPPESLLIRVDPETSVFLQRQWLALAQTKPNTRPHQRPSSSASRPQGREDRGRRSYPARLHAGWLAQTLRPRGWLAPIPEDEQRNLPLPADLVSEPDRGPHRPCAAAMERVILRELSALEEEEPAAP